MSFRSTALITLNCPPLGHLRTVQSVLAKSSDLILLEYRCKIPLRLSNAAFATWLGFLKIAWLARNYCYVTSFLGQFQGHHETSQCCLRSYWHGCLLRHLPLSYVWLTCYRHGQKRLLTALSLKTTLLNETGSGRPSLSIWSNTSWVVWSSSDVCTYPDIFWQFDLDIESLHL